MGDTKVFDFNGVTADIGETIGIVIRGNGVSGTFIGRLAAVTQDTVRLVLTQGVGSIPAGTVLSIRQDEIAAVARIQGVTTVSI